MAGPWGECVTVPEPVDPVQLMLRLARCLEGPLAVLYLLLERCGSRPKGRYQSPFPLGRRKVVAFFERFARFLEQDGRHSFWIMTGGCAERIVHDRHRVIFAYGPTPRFERVLAAEGYAPGPFTLRTPHGRRGRPELDAEARRLLDWWPWIRTPLWPGDAL